MKSSAKNIIMPSLAQTLFNTDDDGERIQEIELSQLHDFHKHPFKVLDDEKMEETIESIKNHGVLMPAIARKRTDGGYELISGHRRKRACEKLELATMPVIVKELDEHEATIIMVDSNIQRETLLFSEKAFAYKMKLDAIKQQGKRTDLTSAQVGQKLQPSVEVVAQEAGESRNQIKRYIRLTFLIQELLDLTDEKKIPFNTAVELSHLSQEHQNILLEQMEKLEIKPGVEQATKMKKFNNEGKLTGDVIESIYRSGKSFQGVAITLNKSKIKRYFPKEYSKSQIEEVITTLLENWSKANN